MVDGNNCIGTKLETYLLNYMIRVPTFKLYLLLKIIQRHQVKETILVPILKCYEFFIHTKYHRHKYTFKF